MAYKKTYSRRNYRYGRKLNKKRYVKRSGRVNYNKIARDVWRLKSLINVEKKDYSAYTSQINFALTDTAQTLQRGDALYKLKGPAQGTTAVTRTGNSIKLTSINVSMRLQGQTSLTDQRQYTIFFLQYNGIPDPAKDATADIATYDNLLVLDFLDYNNGKISQLSFRNKDTFRNWRILKTIRGYLNPDTFSTGGDSFKTFNFWVKPSKGMRHIKFDDNDQDPLQNPIYAFFTSTGGATSSNTGLRAEFSYRMNYIDN